VDRDTTIERFRERLRQVIADSGLTQSAFAARVGIDRSTLSQILSTRQGRLPRVETLAAIGASEQVSVDWLIGLSDVGDVRANLVGTGVELSPGGQTPVDERLLQWHSEAKGYKIRHVPLNIPDLLKSNEVIEYEYARSAAATPEQRIESSSFRLAYQRLPETDMEVCSSVQSLEEFALGHGIWAKLSARTRRAQLAKMVDLCDELYPRYRWFLFDGLAHYSVPLTVFGPLRSSIYIGQMYLVLTGREHIELLIRKFDGLIRSAIVTPPDTVGYLRNLVDRL
jgi:transcriptional regulator with XRE-family HTH domain